MARLYITTVVLAVTATLVTSQPASTSPSQVGPYDYGFDPHQKLHKRQSPSESIVVEGIPTSDDGEPPMRPEIRQLRDDEYGWNLYLLALSMLQYTDQDDVLSYYQIAGIHGLPFQSWNGVQPKSQQTKNTGYCTHSSVLFPIWHRPYLALLEKTLYDYAQEIASWFPDSERQQYIEAAKNWRMPYWDWALDPPDDESIFLPEFTVSGIKVNGPAGVQYIANPLYSYRFNPLDTASFHYVGFQSWKTTQRYPTSNGADATSQNALAAKELDAQTSSLQQRIFTLLSRNEGFHAFSSKVFNSTEGRPHESLEAIHDVIHVATGGRGHLYYIPFSAFDPVFFLHHTNVDRLTAIWQAMYPDEWITQYAAGENSYTTEIGEMVDANTPLTPFYADTDGNFWTSNMARDTRTFGYIYEETVGFPLNGSSAAMSRKNLVSAIVSKYGRAGIGGVINSSAMKKRGESHFQASRRRAKFRVQQGKTLEFAPDFSRHSLIPDPPANAIITNGDKYSEWFVNVNVPNRALESTFAIHFFIGPPPEDTSQWGSACNLVGSVSVFAMIGMGNPNNQIVGTVPLTAALMKMISTGWILSLNEHNVIPFLERNLYVRVAKDSTEAVDTNQVPGLTIKIAKAEVKLSHTGEELPSWGPIENLFTLSSINTK
ncbi:hypothetical protein TD95_003673 [Thielaviopsis punctulata]|uniref:tyrosinase n=1 Tax=Thielaviopsis punctulata TaxID=72032 RepID=A0A0F4ZJV7_9PEZI|nr:hypothetical protein TD95_003673 [Thielaviopsis punctulata]